MQLRSAALALVLAGCAPGGGAVFETPAEGATTGGASTGAGTEGGLPTGELPLPPLTPDLPDETGGAPSDLLRVPAHAQWRHRAIGQPVAGDWTALEFDDSAWSEGQAPFGDGVGALTPIAADQAPIGLRLRRHFQAEAPVEGLLRLDLLRSDGVAVYLNGELLARSNLAAGPLPDDALADDNLTGLEAQRYIQLVAPATAVRAGDNVVAVEVRRYSPGVAGLIFDLQLEPWDPATAPGDQLAAQVRTISRGGEYADSNVAAVWVESDAGFVRTLGLWAEVRREHLIRWRSNSQEDTTDATTAATRKSHGTLDLYWDLRDAAGQAAAPGSYKLLVEYTEDNSNEGDSPGPVYVVPFTLGGGPHVVAAPEHPHFGDVLIVSP